jgi:hypothetical protein
VIGEGRACTRIKNSSIKKENKVLSYLFKLIPLLRCHNQIIITVLLSCIVLYIINFGSGYIQHSMHIACHSSIGVFYSFFETGKLQRLASASIEIYDHHDKTIVLLYNLI